MPIPPSNDELRMNQAIFFGCFHCFLHNSFYFASSFYIFIVFPCIRIKTSGKASSVNHLFHHNFPLPRLASLAPVVDKTIPSSFLDNITSKTCSQNLCFLLDIIKEFAMHLHVIDFEFFK